MPGPVPSDREQARVWFEEGLRQEQARQYPAAVEAYSQAVALWNDYADAWRQRGHVELLRGDARSALMYLEVATGLAPDQRRAWQWRAEAQWKLGAAREAIADAGRALDGEQNPAQRSALLLLRGDAHRDTWQWPQALEDYTEAARLDPASRTAALRRVQTLQQLDRHPEAIAEATRALTLHGDKVEIYFARALSHGQTGRLEESRQDLEQTLALRPSFGDADYALRSVRQQIEDRNRPAQVAQAAPSAETAPAPAVAASTPPQAPIPNVAAAPARTPATTASPRPATITRATRPPVASPSPTGTVPDLPPAARAHLDREQWPQAIAVLEEWLRLHPRSARALNARGYAWLRQRQYARAIADFDRALAIEPTYANARHNRDAAQRASGAPPAPVSAEARWRVALDLIASHQYEPAIRLLDAAIGDKPGYAKAYNARGLARMLQRRYEKAIEDFDRALQLAPGYPNAAHNRRVALKAAGKVS